MTDCISVLVVEDEPLAHALHQETLEEGGFTAVIAASPQQALQALEADGAAYSALVSDINLGDTLTGWDIAKRAREINPSIAVVYMSGLAGDEWVVHGVPKSIMLAKPFAPAQLLTAVSQLLNDA